jgi:hypothetical protein
MGAQKGTQHACFRKTIDRHRTTRIYIRVETIVSQLYLTAINIFDF